MEFTQLVTLKQQFTQALVQASKDEPSSISFIKHTVPSPIVRAGETFQVLVIGGSVFRKALVRKEHIGVTILQKEEQPQPAFTSKDRFLSFINQHLAPSVSTVAVNFAYPLEPCVRENVYRLPQHRVQLYSEEKLTSSAQHAPQQAVMDGKLIAGTKENLFEGLVGQYIGEEIEKHIKSMQGRDVAIAVANDVICLLFSGITLAHQKQLVGAIMGTGTNMTFFHEGNAINTESGNFDGFMPSEECLTIDKMSSVPGKALFEKETSGAYLYQQYNLLLQKQHLPYPPLTSTKDLKMLAGNNTVPRTADIARELIKKSAGMFAAQIAGVAAWKQSDITLIMEGSFFWKNNIYKQHVEHMLKELSPNFTVAIVHIENSPILGGAALVA
jgi:hypothetical protein